MTTVRTRFAPSPTGFMHVGGIRTAVFAYLVAKHAKGNFIVRLEDTDKRREVAGSAEHLLRSLQALQIDYDEGPDIGGPYGPYRQSERLDMYKSYAQKLIDDQRAYADPYSPAQVQAFREAAQKAKQPFLYRNYRPANPPQWDGSQPLRFRSDPKPTAWNDVIMDDLSAGAEAIDDFVLIKSDGYPTYNFAHIIDDCLMKITHIIRGQEFIASTPNYLNLYEALNITPPQFATAPPVLAGDGKKKLSKRDGATDVLEYLSRGILPEALLNFIACLGWNDGTEQELFSRDELIEKFSLSQVNKGGAQFDERRLLWMNGSYIRTLPLLDLSSRIAEFWSPKALQASPDYRLQVLAISQERLKYLGEINDITAFFFEDFKPDMSLIQTHKQLSRLTKSELIGFLETTASALKLIDFDKASLDQCLNTLLDETGQKPVVLLSLIRIAVTRVAFSPGLADTLVVLGKDTSLSRITEFIAYLQTTEE